MCVSQNFSKIHTCSLYSFMSEKKKKHNSGNTHKEPNFWQEFQESSFLCKCTCPDEN